MEEQVTIPIESQMNGIPHLSHLRSESVLGLLFALTILDDASENDWNRRKTLERLNQVDLPAGRSSWNGTDWSVTGQIYRYTLRVITDTNWLFG